MTVLDRVEAAVIASINLSEVFSRMMERGAPRAEADARINLIGIAVIDFDRQLALMAAALRKPTRHMGLSLADRACLALAQRLNLPVLTGDRIWAELDLGIEVELIR